MFHLEKRERRTTKMSQHELLFLNPVLHKGLNVTVRDGEKWFQKAKVGDELNIYKTGDTNYHKRVALACVVGLAFLPCNMIPAEWLLLEHDSTCRDQNGLFKAMVRAYGNNFQASNLVTVILFDVLH